ncbi:MAG: hypothetical protein IKO27_02325 [Ruminococcus sp.]|nr:hypothetical protein [Ruminococcus sp.]
MELKKNIKGFISRSTLPILLGCIIVNMVVKCYYYEQATVLTVLFAAVATGLFWLFDRLKDHKLVGALVYFAMLGSIGFLASRLMSLGWSSTNIMFTDWFYLNRDTAGFNIYYFLLVYIFGGFFLVSIIYYFTRIRFRSLGLMLCLLFPFVIYAKRSDVMSGYQVTLIITVFLAIVVHLRQQQGKPASVLAVHDLAYVVTVALFVSLAGAVSMLLPKPEVKSVLERDSHAFDITPFRDARTTYSRYSNTSSARFGASYSGEVLFSCESDYDTDVYYLKRQSYDYFSGDTWHNDRDRAAEKYVNTDYYSRININRSEYYEALKALAESGKYMDHGLDPKRFTVRDMTVHYFRVFDDTFRGVYVPAPSGVIAKRFTESMDDPYYLYGDGEITVRNVDRDYDYTVSYYPQTDEYVSFASALGMTGDDYYTMLLEAKKDGAAVDKLIEQYTLAVENYTGGIEYDPRMKELAEQITAGQTSDYAKARALEQYYKTAGFTYDIDYEPDDTSIEYFLFESKTGSCTSYATSMAMMARILGLPARYVEGFAAYERNEDGELEVHDSNAHAYVEVFIPGAGWLDFDPTITEYVRNSGGAGGGIGGVFSSLGQIFSRVFVFIAVIVFIVIVMLLDRILEFIFRIGQHFTKGDKRIIRLYARVVKLLEYSGGDDLSSYTANMLIDYARQYNNADIGPIARLFERTCFGSQPMEDEKYKEIYAHYRSVYKFLRKRPSPKKQKSSGAAAGAGS